MPPPTPIAGSEGRWTPCLTPGAAVRLCRWLRSSGLGDSPTVFFGALSARFRLTGPDGNTLSTKIRKGGVIHAFLGRLMAEAATVLGLAELTLLGVGRDGGAHILHSLFSGPVGPYGPNRRLFGCRGELPPEGLPTNTKIPVASFGALRAVKNMSWDDYRVHLEGSPPSSCQTMPYEREISKEEGQSLSCRRLTFLPPDAATPLFHLEVSIGAFSK